MIHPFILFQYPVHFSLALWLKSDPFRFSFFQISSQEDNRVFFDQCQQERMICIEFVCLFWWHWCWSKCKNHTCTEWGKKCWIVSSTVIYIWGMCNCKVHPCDSLYQKMSDSPSNKLSLLQFSSLYRQCYNFHFVLVFFYGMRQ